MHKHEAEAEATKRNAHKNPRLVEKEWRAVFDQDRQTWLPRLVDSQFELARVHRNKAQTALKCGDLLTFLDAASDALLASARASINDYEGKDP